MNDIFNLENKVAIVTGGSGHIGSEFSKALAEKGASLIVSSRYLEKAESFINSLNGEHLALELDLTNEDSINKFFDRALNFKGKIDILVNNAVNLTAHNIDNATKDDFFNAFDSSVYSHYILARKSREVMLKNNSNGSIINIASMYGLVGSYPEVYKDLPFGSPPAYHAVKSSIIHLTRHLAVYWAKDNIRVNCISPGAFPNIQDGKDWAEFVKRLKSKIPMNRVGNPKELQGALLLLASDAGSYITGQNIIVDGGWTSW